MESRKIVITGACGFVGSNLSRVLFNLGFQVYLIDNLKSFKPNPGLHYLNQDLTKVSTEDLINVFQNSTVIHLAAISSSSECEKFPQLAFEVNLSGTKKVIDATNAANAKLIFASSEWVYPEGSSEEAIDELATVNISQETNIYSMTKIVGEWLVQKYSKNYLILRFGIIYGEREVPQGAVENIVRLAMDSKLVEVGNLRTSRRFIHVQDVCEGIAQCVSKSQHGKNEIFNLTGSKLIALGEVVKLLKTYLKNDFLVKEGDAPRSLRNIQSDKFYRTFDWKPKISIEVGIQRIMRWELDNMKGRNEKHAGV